MMINNIVTKYCLGREMLHSKGTSADSMMVLIKVCMCVCVCWWVSVSGGGLRWQLRFGSRLYTHWLSGRPLDMERTACL